MCELRRILLSRALIITTLLLFIFNGCQFVYDQVQSHPYATSYKQVQDFEHNYRDFISEYVDTEWSSAINELERALATANETANQKQQLMVERALEQINYVSSYQSYVANIQKQASQAGKFGFLNQQDTYTTKNVKYTSDQFAKMLTVTTELGSDRALSAFIEARVQDVCIILIMLFVSLMFAEDRKMGLNALIHATSNGRSQLAIKRLAILFALSTILTILFLGETFALSMDLYGAPSHVQRSIQSMSMFQTLTYRISINQFMIIYLSARVLTVYFLSVLFAVIVCCVSNYKLSLFVLLVSFGLSYAATFIPLQSTFVIFRFLNLFSYLWIAPLFSQYHNVSLFGLPMNANVLVFLACLISLLILSILFLRQHVKTNRNIPFSPWNKQILRFQGIIRTIYLMFHLLAFEVYKHFYLQKALAVVCCMLLISIVFPYSNDRFYDDTVRYELQLIDQFQGPLTIDRMEAISQYQENASNIVSSFGSIEKLFEQDGIDYADYYIKSMEALHAMRDVSASTSVLERASELLNVQQRVNAPLWLINEEPFHSIYGHLDENEKTMTQSSFIHNQTIALLLILALSISLAGMSAFDHQSKMHTIIRSSSRGREIWTHKLASGILYAFILWMLMYGVQTYRLISQTGIEVLAAPVQSLSFMNEFPLKCSIAVAIALLQVYRLLALMFCAIVIISLSVNAINQQRSITITCILTVIPSFAYGIMGVNSLRAVSMSVPVSAVELFMESRGGINKGVIFLLVWLVLALMSVVYYMKRHQHR